MRKIAATYIFPVEQPPLKNGILVCDDQGTIREVIDTGGILKEQAGLEYYNGFLVPGFVNAHCHLELSHLEGRIAEKTGMGEFIGAINRLRQAAPEKIQAAIEKANQQMEREGIAAAGDISNSLLTLATKKTSKIRYHTFAEAFGFDPARAEKAFSQASSVADLFRAAGLPASVVPHSPYAVSPPLFKKIIDKALDEKSILSIHNQESRAEARFFHDGTGPIADHLQKNLGIGTAHWKPPGKSSLMAVMNDLPPGNPLLLVHNTFTAAADIATLKMQRPEKNTFFVLCPRSNQYIEDALPPLPLFEKEKGVICLGTDSLASNHRLSVISEMIELQKHFPEIRMNDLISWATMNGARALEMDKHLGSFTPGKQPGINLITGADLKNRKLTANSRVKVLISA